MATIPTGRPSKQANLEIERLANLGAVEYDEDIEEKVEDVDQDNETEVQDEPKEKSKKASKK